MILFLKKSALFVVVFIAVAQIFYLFIHISPNLEIDKRLEKTINGEINKDVVVLGSSRGARNIIAGQIEDSLGLSAYNLSYPGSNIEFHEFLLRSLIKFNSPPQKVLLAVDAPTELSPDQTLNFRLDRLYPLTKYKYINNEMIKRGEKNFMSRFFTLARINKNNFDIRVKKFSELDSLLECGSMPISFQRKDRDFQYNNTTRVYDTLAEQEVKIEAFNKIQSLCQENNIKLILIFSPNFGRHNISFEKRLRDISKENVDFYVYDTLKPAFSDKSYFYDEGHLQTNGAIIFTNDIISYLKSTQKEGAEISLTGEIE